LIQGNDGDIVGIFPLFLKETRRKRFIKDRVLFSGGWGICGLALINELGDKYRSNIEEFAYEHVDQLAKEHNVDILEIRLPPLAPVYLPPHVIRINPLLRHGLQDNSTATFLIDLMNNSLDDLWQHMEGRSRTAIRKAEKAGVKIREIANRGEVEEHYYRLHCQTYRHTGVSPHPLSYFTTIYENGWAKIFLAECEEQIIAALNVAAFKTGVLYWTSASNPEYYSVNPNNLLQWYAIQWAKEQGYSWYESGEALLGTDNPKLKGLTEYKGSFGGELYPFYKGIKIYKPVKKEFFDLIRELRHKNE
jgi:lipid II:glycine glycyltransferase (peptidoglycan interpeptide bridge formation enzyme)